MNTTTTTDITINYFVSVALSLDLLDRIPDEDKVHLLHRVDEIASGHTRHREYLENLYAFGIPCRARVSEFVYYTMPEAQAVADLFEMEFLRTGWAVSVAIKKCPVKTGK